MAIRRLKRKTTVELLWPYVLQLLKRRPMYAYEIRQTISKKFGFKPPMVTSYLVLYKLQRGGHVTVEWKKRPKKPARKYYKITDKGLELLKMVGKYFCELARKFS